MNKKYNITKKFLIKEYIKYKKSIRQIAKEIKCHYTTVNDYLKKYDIPRRTISEANKGRKHTKESKDKISKAHIGKPSGMKDKHHTAKTCQKISKSMKNFIKHHDVKERLVKNLLKENHPWNYKGGKERLPNCIDCNKKLSSLSAKRCNSCELRNRQKDSRNHWNWQGGLSFEPYPLGWNKTYKKQIRERDNNQCQICGKLEIELKGFHKKLSIHHIDYDKKNIDPNNLISLCIPCHLKTNGNRDYWYAYFMYIMEV